MKIDSLRVCSASIFLLISSGYSWGGLVRIDRDMLSFCEQFERTSPTRQDEFLYTQTSHQIMSHSIVEEDHELDSYRKEFHSTGDGVIGIDLNGHSRVTLSSHSKEGSPEDESEEGLLYLSIDQQVNQIPGLVNRVIEFPLEMPLTIRRGSWQAFQEGERIELHPTREGQKAFLEWYESRFKQVLLSFYEFRGFDVLNLQIQTRYVSDTFAQRWLWGPQFHIEADTNEIVIQAPHMQMNLEAGLKKVSLFRL